MSEIPVNNNAFPIANTGLPMIGDRLKLLVTDKKSVTGTTLKQGIEGKIVSYTPPFSANGVTPVFSTEFVVQFTVVPSPLANPQFETAVLNRSEFYLLMPAPDEG